MLLSFAGQSKYGRKQEIFKRATALLDKEPSLALRLKIQELFK